MPNLNHDNSLWPRFLQFGSRRKLARWSTLLPAIETEESKARKLNDEELRKASMALRYRAKTGEPLDRLLVPAYGLVREAARRTISMRHFHVQVLAAIAMHHKSFVEMQTGEGKTLTATMPVYLHALQGKGCHVVTSNEYLASRDTQLMGPVYTALGLTVGALQPRQSRPEKRELYARDITYGTSAQFGFDFLRDALAKAATRETNLEFMAIIEGTTQRLDEEAPVQRDRHFALIDEADDILIDAARSSLTFHAPGEKKSSATSAGYHWAAEAARELHEPEDYTFDPEKKRAELTLPGRRRIRDRERPEELDPVGLVDLYQQVELAVRVKHAYLRDRNYVVSRGRIVPLNEQSGRLRKRGTWSAGVQQAIQAKEGLDVTGLVGSAARMTIQDYYRRYKRLAGMSGTLAGCEREIKQTYRCHVTEIPTNRPVRRNRWPDLVFGTQLAKWQAAIEETKRLHQQGRPVLIGTCSITGAEEISKLLKASGIDHQVLHARHHKKEAAIIAKAGQHKAVTVATNMAGRGTDIKLGEGVAELGGLHVICTEMHNAARLGFSGDTLKLR